MSHHQITIIERSNNFGSDLIKLKNDPGSLGNKLASWFASLIVFLIISNFMTNVLSFLVLIVHLYFLIVFLKEIYQHIRIPIEFMLILIFIGFVLLFYLKSLLLTSDDAPFLNGIIRLFHHFVLWCIVLLFGLVLTINASGKRGDLFLFTILGLVGHFILSENYTYLYYIFCGLIIIIEISRTRWLEDLSKTECWIYMLVLVLFYRITAQQSPYIYPLRTEEPTIFLYTMPFYLFLLFKFYLLAMLIKLPIVLIYNHAGLSRKLKISGLFQSTFPQFIQFVILVLMFYLFISSWQAQNLRNQINRVLNTMEDSEEGSIINYRKINVSALRGVDDTVLIDDSKISLAQLPDEGVIDLSNEESEVNGNVHSYWLFYKQIKDSVNYQYFVNIDTTFMQSISKNLQVLAGTSILAHRIMPSKWTSYLYELDLMQGRGLFRYFLFGSTPSKIKPDLRADLPTTGEQVYDVRQHFGTFIKQEGHLSFGRIYIPLVGLNRITDRYFAMDIVFTIGDDLLWSGLPQIFTVLTIIYFLINIFVIRRVITFGSQINKMIVNKFNQLKHGIRQISSGNLDYKIRLGGEDEFVELADHFNEMGDRLKQTMDEAREKDRLQYELHLARQVQLSLLPETLPEIPHYIISASMETATEVGGDFYDFMPLGNGKYLFSIGDVSGKGSSAALYMAQYMSLFRYSRQFTNEPKKIAQGLNDYFSANVNDLQIFITAIIGLLDTNTHTIEIIRMGHTEPVIIPADDSKKIRFLKAKGIGVGLTRKFKTFDRLVESKTISMDNGDTLFMYTDGIIEANKVDKGEDGEGTFEQYGEEKLYEILTKNRNRAPFELIKLLEEDIERFYDGRPRIDDQTLLIIRRSDV
ncbi:SpoIIE family protein phosphatase [candidate division KSB1 bacterium]|nr:SpoIIE family protein phosphatase [candidate division KSB1 bacterium]